MKLFGGVEGACYSHQTSRKKQMACVGMALALCTHNIVCVR